MTYTQEEAMELIRLNTNSSSNEINHESIFDAVIATLENKISKSEFQDFFVKKTSVIGAKFNNDFINELYQAYDSLYPYLYLNKSKLK